MRHGRLLERLERIKALAATKRGIPRREVLETFGISLATLKRWLKKSREGEDLSPRFSTGRKRRILCALEERRALWTQLEANEEATLERHCELWEEKRGVSQGVHRDDEPGYTGQARVDLRKRTPVPPSETKRREVLVGENS